MQVRAEPTQHVLQTCALPAPYPVLHDFPPRPCTRTTVTHFSLSFFLTTFTGRGTRAQVRQRVQLPGRHSLRWCDAVRQGHVLGRRLQPQPLAPVPLLLHPAVRAPIRGAGGRPCAWLAPLL